MHPYDDSQLTASIRIRVFDPNKMSEESTWHRDAQDRTVVILESAGWRIQHEDEMPITLRPGDVLQIESYTWHRILPGTGNLVAVIKEI